MDLKSIHDALIKSGKTLALAESCTGGKIAASLTSIPGASKFLLGSLVVYSNEWKEKFLHVSPKTLQKHGAVSAETVKEMVAGLFTNTSCDLAAAVSGVAGPDGGTPEKPVGTIYIAVCKRGEEPQVQLIHAPPHRDQAIDLAVKKTLSALIDLL